MNIHLHTLTSAFRTALFSVFVFAAASAHADAPAFEAYYKFYLGNTHTGYVIQRLEVLDSKKEMVSTYYCYVKTPGGPTVESLVARADLNFEPLSYSYTALSEGKPKIIDATFKMKKMTAKITEGAAGQTKTRTMTLQVPNAGFLSTFLNYVVLKNGLSVGKNYKFFALSEEDPGFHEGTANILAEQKVKQKIDAFKIDISFKGVSFVGLVATNGEPLGTLSPEQNASTEMVATRAEAVGSLPFNEKQIKTLFGGIPEGRKNKMNAPDVAPQAPPPQSSPTLLMPTDKPKGQ
jgi:hypothetical protein